MHITAARDIGTFAGQQFATAASVTDHGVVDSLSDGVYDVWAAADTYIKVASDVSGLTATNGYLIKASATPVSIFIRKGLKLGSIGSVSTLNIHKAG